MKHTRRRHLQLIAAAPSTPALPRLVARKAGPPSRSARSSRLRRAAPSTSSPASCSSRCRSSSASRWSSRTVAAAAARSARRGRARGARRLHAVGPFLRARDDAGDLSERALRHCQGFRRRRGASAVRPTSSSWRPRRASRRCRSWSLPPRQKPGAITFGTAGVGSATHISAEICASAPASRRCTSRSAGCPRCSPRS